MAEIIAVLGLGATVVTLVEAGAKLLRRLSEAKDSDNIFADIADQLPLILSTIKFLKEGTPSDNLDERTGQAVIRAVEGCLRQVQSLEPLIEEFLIVHSDGKLQRLRKAIGAAKVQRKVQQIQGRLETYKSTLTLHLGGYAAQNKVVHGQAEWTEEFIKLPKSQVVGFVGRDDILKRLDEVLIHREQPRVVVLQAMGGQGKTQIALEFCRRARQAGTFKTIIWVDATSSSTIARDIGNLAEDFDSQGRRMFDLKSRVDFVKQRLEAWRSPFLIVFDNCDQPNALQAVKEALVSNTLGSHLCTSRHRHSERLGPIIEVPAMSIDDGLVLLLSRSKNEGTSSNLDEGRLILQQLGGLPLAIDQAASYIKTRRLALSAFRSHYEERKAEVLNHTPQIWEYRKRLAVDQSESPISVFTTWELAVEDHGGKVDPSNEEEANTTRKFLESVSFFDCSSIPEDLPRLLWTRVLREPLGKTKIIHEGVWNSTLYQDLLAELLANSLITSLSFERETASFSLHPFVRDWACLRLTEDKREKHVIAAAEALCLSHEDSGISSTSSHLDRKKLASQFDAIFENSERFLKHGARLGEGPLVNQALLFASFYDTHYYYKKAEVLLSRAFAAHRIRYGKDSLFTVGVQMDLADMLQHRRKWEQAEEYYRHSQIQRNIFHGPNHPETLKATEGLAWSLSRRGKIQEGVGLLRGVLKAKEFVYGLEHGATLHTVLRLAIVFSNVYDSTSTELLCLRCIGAPKVHLSIGKVTIAHPFLMLAKAYRLQGRVIEATALLHQAYTEYRKDFNSSDPICLEIALDFSLNLVAEGEYESAKYLAQIVKERSSQLGEDQRLINKAQRHIDLATAEHQRYVAEVSPTSQNGTKSRHTTTCRYCHTDHEPELTPDPASQSDALQRLKQRISHLADDLLYGTDRTSGTNRDLHITQPTVTATGSAEYFTGIQPQLSAPCYCVKEARCPWSRLEPRRPQQDSLTKLSISLNMDFRRSLEGLYLKCGISSAWTDMYGQTNLHRAVSYGHADDVQAILVSTGVDVNAIDNYDNSALTLATLRGHHEIVGLLMNHPDTNVNARNNDHQTCLHVAADYRQAAIMRRLMEHKDIYIDEKDDSERTPFWLACAGGLDDIVSIMLDKSLVDYNMKSDTGRTPLMIASRNGHKAVVKLLLKQKCIKVNAKTRWNRTALASATWRGNNNIVRALISAGADVNEVDDDDETITFDAILGHSNKTIQLLLDMSSVDPDIPNWRGITPLARAAARGNNDGVEMLIRSGKTDVNFEDDEGHSPLYKALQNGHAKIVEMLLGAGANPDIVVQEFESYTWANSKRHKEQGLKALQMVKDAQAQQFRSGDIDDFGLTRLFALTNQDGAGDKDGKEVEAGAPELAGNHEEQAFPIQG